jgi:biotin operon repressor
MNKKFLIIQYQKPYERWKFWINFFYTAILVGHFNFRHVLSISTKYKTNCFHSFVSFKQNILCVVTKRRHCRSLPRKCEYFNTRLKSEGTVGHSRGSVNTSITWLQSEGTVGHSRGSVNTSITWLKSEGTLGHSRGSVNTSITWLKSEGTVGHPRGSVNTSITWLQNEGTVRHAQGSVNTSITRLKREGTVGHARGSVDISICVRSTAFTTRFWRLSILHSSWWLICSSHSIRLSANRSFTEVWKIFSCASRRVRR